MERQDNMPLWVHLAFSGISTRKGALILTFSCLLFAIYCLPWSLFLTEPEWLSSVFLIDDWSWFAMMAPVTIWYWISLKWMDKHSAW